MIREIRIRHMIKLDSEVPVSKILDLLPRIQEIQQEILGEIIRICEKHDIMFQMYAGSLLGAVRHNGPIPWDDDIDIAMLRPHYERFLKICEKELKPEFFLQTRRTDPESPQTFAKIRRNGTTYRERAIGHLNMHHGIYVDVFVFDTVPKHYVPGRIHEILILLGHKIRTLKYTQTKTPSRLRHFFEPICKIIPASWLDFYFEKLFKMWAGSNSPFVSQLGTGISKNGYWRCRVPKLDFSNRIYEDFNGISVPIPPNYHHHLTKHYGNYMELPKIKNRIPKVRLAKLGVE